MPAEKQSESKSVDDLVADFKKLVAEANEIRQQMKELTREIEARTGSGPIAGMSSTEIEVPK